MRIQYWNGGAPFITDLTLALFQERLASLPPPPHPSPSDERPEVVHEANEWGL